jgi:hypothetical protein
MWLWTLPSDSRPMKWSASPGGEHGAHGVAPGGADEHRAGGDRLVDELGPLVEDPAGAERVVADLAVAHVGVGRHADRGAVREQAGERRQGAHDVEVGRVRLRDGVAEVAEPEADAVHDDRHDRAFGGAARGVCAEGRDGHACFKTTSDRRG